MLPLIICLWGYCFNPQTITNMHNDREFFGNGTACIIGFNRSGAARDWIRIDRPCEDAAAEINREVEKWDTSKAKAGN